MGSEAVRSWKSKWDGWVSEALRARMAREWDSGVDTSSGGIVRRARRR